MASSLPPKAPASAGAAPSSNGSFSMSSVMRGGKDVDIRKADAASALLRSGARKSTVGAGGLSKSVSMPQDNEPTVFDAAGDSRASSSSFGSSRARATRSQSMYYVDKSESRDPALKNLWNGNWAEAQRGFDANRARDPLANVRYAEVQFLRFWLSADKTLADSVIERFGDAEKACLEAAREAALQLAPALEKHAAKQPLLRRMSRRASLTAPWTTALGITRGDNPGELMPSLLEYKQEKTALEDWKRLQGLAALCALLAGATHMLSNGYVRGALSLRRAWQISQRATNNLESHQDPPSALGLVHGTFQVVLDNVPPWVLSFLKALGGVSGSAEEGKKRLEGLLAGSDPVGETHNYARLALAGYYLMTSQQEYRSDRALLVKKANEIVSAVVEKHPDWILFKWMQSHVHRRLGRIPESLTVVDGLAKQLAREYNDLGVSSYRLPMDRATLLMVSREYAAAEKSLMPLVEPESEFTAKGLAFAMLAAGAAMRNDVVTSVKWLEVLDDQINEKSASRQDNAWLWKIPCLMHRPNKCVLWYELNYLFGYVKWFDADVAGSRSGASREASGWLERCKRELEQILAADQVSVVYPEFPVSKEEASEELVVVSLLLGSICAMIGELDVAEKHFNFILDNKDAPGVKEGLREDPFPIPFALYELGTLEIRRGNPIKARSYLSKSLGYCKAKMFSFHHSLSFRCTGAMRYVAGLARPKGIDAHSVEWKAHQDELGAWIGNDATAGAGPNIASSDMLAVVAGKGSKIEVSKPMKLGQTLSWQWTVESHDVWFQAIFKADKPGADDDPIVAEPAKFEAGDFNEGFFTAASKSGRLILEWDNTRNKSVDKKIYYAVESA